VKSWQVTRTTQHREGHFEPEPDAAHGLRVQVVADPEDGKGGQQVAQAEERDAADAGRQHDEQRGPVEVAKYKHLEHVQAAAAGSRKVGHRVVLQGAAEWTRCALARGWHLESRVGGRVGAAVVERGSFGAEDVQLCAGEHEQQKVAQQQGCAWCCVAVAGQKEPGEKIAQRRIRRHPRVGPAQ